MCIRDSLSPGYAIGSVTGGPFGVNQQLPFVNATVCPSSTLYLYEGYLPTCGGTNAEGNLENPYGTTPPKTISNPKASDLSNYLPNAYSILNTGTGAPGVINNGQPISLGVYDRANKLPYTINYTLDIQWQPRSDLAIELGYVGNVGRHQVIPVPFNQPNIASPSNPALPGSAYQQNYSYGYNVVGATLAPGSATGTGLSLIHIYSAVRNGCSTCWPRCFWRASSISELTEACSRARAVRVIQQVQDCRQVYAYFSTVKQRGYCLSLGDLYGQNAILCLISGSILFSPRGACDSHNFSVQRFRKRP